MRAVVQKVSEAHVKIEKKGIVGKIGNGFLIYLAVENDDTTEDLNYILDKTINMRIYPDDAGHMNLPIDKTNNSIMVVSQFTLYGDVRKGRRPSFTRSAKQDKAEKLYDLFINSLILKGFDVEKGEFGADMKVSSINDGPVTILLDSRREF